MKGTKNHLSGAAVCALEPGPALAAPKGEFKQQQQQKNLEGTRCKVLILSLLALTSLPKQQLLALNKSKPTQGLLLLTKS